MAQIRNRFDLQNSLQEDEVKTQKKLPAFFMEKDELGFFKGISLSTIVHIILAILIISIAAVNDLFFSFLPKPELPKRDIEFKLVQGESKPPINKNTKIRSDRDSQAGGKHDPKKAVSQPSSLPAKKQTPKTQPAKQTPKPAKAQNKPTKQPVKQPIKQPVRQPVKPQPKTAQKPTPIKAPTAKPTIKPTYKPNKISAPSAPKITNAPKSPFNIPVAPTKAPVGTTYKPQGSTTGGVGSSRGTSNSAPAPKFSSSGGSGSRGSSAGSSGQGSRYASRGSSGGYGAGNPSPGNPNGAPGIDALRQPNWGPYMRDLEQRIKRNWSPPKGDSSKRVVIVFSIGRDGRLLSHKVTKSSGVPLVDRAAMSAIELTAPFRPLPPEFKGQSVPIEFTFDYNVLNSILR